MKRIISILLCIMMVFSLVPTAFAEGKEGTECTNAVFENGTKETYTWAADGSKCTATIICKNCDGTESGHKLTEAAAITSERTKAPSCTTKGETTYTATFTNTTYFEEQTKTLDVKANGHDYVEHAAVAATCKTTGNEKYYTCENCSLIFNASKAVISEIPTTDKLTAVFENGTKETYSLSADFNTCTATIICKNCDGTEEGHKITETVTVTSEVTTPATCTTKGETTYTATFTNTEYFETQTKVIEDVDALGHSFAEANGVKNVGEGKHNFKCVRCDAYGIGRDEDKTEDCYGGTATCVNKAICSKCNIAYGTLSSHTYGEPKWYWAEDGKSVDNVIFTCTVCQDKYVGTPEISSKITAQPTCEDKGIRTYTATVVVEGKTYTNSKNIEEIAALGHTMTKTAAKAATCTSTGNNEYWTCSTCKKVFKDDAGTTPTTVKAETIAKTAHSFTSKTTTEQYLKSAATCTSKAVYYYKCANCPAKGTQTYIVGDVGGHILDISNPELTVNEDDPTTGNLIFTCTVCPGTVTKPTTLTELSRTEATCTKAGAVNYNCTVELEGNKIIIPHSLVIPKLGHSFVSKTQTKTYLKSAATCTSAAVYYYKCSRCNAKGTKTYTVGKALGHDWDSGNVTKKATCTATGVKTYTCTRCKITKTENINKTGHSFTSKTVKNTYAKKAATCTTSGTYYYKCVNCSAKGTETYTVKALGHSFTSKTQTKTYLKSKATCTKAAVYYYKCARCAAKGTKTYTGKALGHNYNNTVTTRATLSDDGKIVRTCGRCSVKTTTVIYRPKTITLSQTSYTCTGKAIKPTVTVKDSKGKTVSSSNYTLSYSNNINPTYKGSKATVTVKFKGNYSGSKTLTFNIKLDKVEITSKSMSNEYIVSMKWKSVPGATKYEVYYYDNTTGAFKSDGTVSKPSFTQTWNGWPQVKFKVRAVYMKGSKVVAYGPWSSVITVNHK